MTQIEEKMISLLSEWVKNLSLALIIVSILEMILPDNKTKKYVKMIMGLYILFSIIAPFIENNTKLDFNSFDTYIQDIEEISKVDTKVDQTSMDKRLDELYKEKIEKDIIEKIEEKGYEVESCKVSAHIAENDSGIEKISIKIKEKIDKTENLNSTDSIENKVVTEIQKIQKVEIKVSDNEENINEQEKSNITKTDIKIIKDFLMKEYEVSEECLKIS